MYERWQDLFGSCEDEEEMKILILIFISLFFINCASLQKFETEIVKSDGEIIIIKSKSDALVKYKDGNEEVEVDNRGRPSFLETILGGWLIRGDRSRN